MRSGRLPPFRQQLQRPARCGFRPATPALALNATHKEKPRPEARLFHGQAAAYLEAAEAAGAAAEAAGAAAQAYWAVGLTVSSVLIAIFAPILGAIADGTGRRLVWVWFFSVFYVVGSYALWFIAPGGDNLFWAVLFFGLGFIGMEFATIFTPIE